MTTRSYARRHVIDEVAEAARRDHLPSFHKLHVYRDGGIWWVESIEQSEDVIGSGAVPSVCCVGTGSAPAGCDFCDDGAYETIEEGIDHAGVGDGPWPAAGWDAARIRRDPGGLLRRRI